jgi:hypothetical protein
MTAKHFRVFDLTVRSDSDLYLHDTGQVHSLCEYRISRLRVDYNSSGFLGFYSTASTKIQNDRERNFRNPLGHDENLPSASPRRDSTEEPFFQYEWRLLVWRRIRKRLRIALSQFKLDEVFESFFRFKGSSMEGKTIRIDFSEQEVAVLHRAVFELQSRPSISPRELRAIQSAEQKILLAARLAGLNLHH